MPKFSTIIKPTDYGIANAGILLKKHDILKPKGFGEITIKDESGIVISKFHFTNVITNAGLNWILNNVLSTSNLYLGAIESNGSNTATTTASSTSVTLGTSASWSNNQWVTIAGAGIGGVAYLGQAVGSGVDSTALTVTPATPTAVNGALLTWGPTFSETDTENSHPGWTEVNITNVTNLTRPRWIQNGSATSQQVTNSNNSSNLYTLSNTASQQYWTGFFLSTSNTWGDTGAGNTLVSEFPIVASVLASGYNVSLTYTISMTSSATS